MDAITQSDRIPFGLRMDGFSFASGNPYNKLKYSGKELDQEQGQYKYHFGWRDYYPELGRWVVVDPARQFASPYVYGGNNPVIGIEEDGRWFGIDDLIASAIGFTIGYLSEGLSTGNWGEKAFVKGGIGALAAWVGWNTGGASLAAGGELSFAQTIGYGTSSGAFSGLTYGSLNYLENAASSGDTYTMRNLKKNWDTTDFLESTVTSGITGAISGAVISGAVYGLEFAADELGYLNEKIKVKEGMGVEIDKVQFPKGTNFTAKDNALTLEKMGIPIRNNVKSLGKEFTFGEKFTKVDYFFTMKGLLYKSTGFTKHVVDHFRHTLVHIGTAISTDSKLENSIYRGFKSLIKKYLDDEKRQYWLNLYKFKF